LRRPERITIGSQDAMFDRFEQTWLFELAQDGGTVVEFRAHIELRSPLLQAVMGAFFEQAARTMVQAFSHRARQLYGAARGAQQ